MAATTKSYLSDVDLLIIDGDLNRDWSNANLTRPEMVSHRVRTVTEAKRLYPDLTWVSEIVVKATMRPQTALNFVRWLKAQNYQGHVLMDASFSSSRADIWRGLVTTMMVDQLDFMGYTQLKYISAKDKIDRELMRNWRDQAIREEILGLRGDLFELERAANGGDVVRVYNDLCAFDVAKLPGHCSCETEYGENRWRHAHHRLVERAVRDVIVLSGLGPELRRRVVEDIASPDQYIGEEGPFGFDLLKSYGWRLVVFLQAV